MTVFEGAIINIMGGVHNVPPPEPNEVTEVKYWKVFEVESAADKMGKTRHLVAYCILDNEGRVSSNIVEVVPNAEGKLLLKTGSGRIYHLQGPPGSHSEASYVWGIWRHRNQVTFERDVTKEYI